MSTPFTSGFSTDKIAPLKFWTHKILPLVYEESLSYYEVLCKVTQKLNETIEKANLAAEEVAHIREIVDNLNEAIEAIQSAMVKSVNGKYPDAEGGVIVDAPSVPLNPPLVIAGQSRDYLQEAISALITVDTQAAEELHEYMRNSAPYLVQISNVGGTPELSVTGAEYDEMMQDVSEHGKTILVSFPDDEYTYNGESYRVYPQIGKLITNGVLEVSRVVSIAGASLYEQYRFDRNGYISYERRNCPDLPVAPSENGEYALIRAANGLSWGSVSDTISDVESLNQYWKPTVLPITYTPSNGNANPIYSVAGFHELVPTDEGAIIVEIRVAGQAPVHVQGYYVPGDAEHFPYVHAIIHERVETKNILRVFLLYPQYVNVLDYDLEILKKAVLTVNGLTPNSAGAVSVDATNINMDENTPPVTVHDEVVRIGEKVDNSWSLGKGLNDILYGAPQDGQRYKLTGVYDETAGMSVPQWVIDTLAGLVQSVNGQRPDSTGAVAIDGTVIMLGATPTPISIQNKIAQMDTVITNNDTDIKGVLDMLNSAPLDGQRYKLTARYVQNSTKPTFQWVLDT